jgi:hypothetical protein
LSNSKKGSAAFEGRLPAREPAAVFIAHLEELPLAAWLAATRQRQHVRDRAKTESALDAIIRGLPDQALVLTTRNAVLYALQRFASPEGRYITRVRRASEHLRPATEQAALAVLARDHLSPEQFTALYEPFELLIPAVLLFGLPR